ncbi:methyltransferase domain-containing protein [Sphaerisporangium aureirubrum]|uniref:Methyltransferase domain-containing protein n=1 Tax=Sphaerisporangium aureirubrum TaxID=1544736 RepID=A0ABW1NT64_9ACTN
MSGTGISTHEAPPGHPELRCPACRGPLRSGFTSHTGRPGGPERRTTDHSGEELRCDGCGAAYPVDRGIPRFVPRDNYAESFGFQWNRHRLTQLDSVTGLPISRERLTRQSRWAPEDLRGRHVLECGSGAGRFTEVLCESGAVVTSVDISSAVHANAASNGHHPGLRLLQASIHDMPLPEDAFDYLLCLGVIQHTPDVERTFKSLFRHLRPGGRFCVDVYAAPVAYPHLRQLLRPVTKRMPPDRLYALVERAVPRLLPISSALARVPLLGPYLTRLVPVANHAHLGLSGDTTALTWSILDTFDWLAPWHEKPQTRRALRRWTADLALRDVTIERHRGLYVVRGVK